MSPVRKTRLGDAKALERWPLDGVQKEPEAWLLRVARNRIMTPPVANKGRQDSKRFLQQIAEEAQTVAATHEHLPDERETLFVALKLETSLGVEAARVASSFLVSSAAMGQWLVRDKKQNPSTVGQSPKNRDGHLNSENLKISCGITYRPVGIIVPFK